jgi:hypothetical protein
MPKGPHGEKRPADVIGNAVKVMRIATGEEEEVLPERSGAAELGAKGGKARAATLSKKRRSEIAKKAAARPSLSRASARASSPGMLSPICAARAAANAAARSA